MKNIFFYIILFSPLFAYFGAFAQRQDTIPIINFRAVDAVTEKPVEMAHVINKTRKKGAVADLLGYFKIPVYIGDTISVTSLGYHSLTIYSKGQFSKDSVYYSLKLKPKVYQIKELKISWFASYDKFLKGVLELNLPITKEEERVNRIVGYFSKTISSMDLKNLPGASSGAAFGKDWLAKQNEKLKEQMEKERKKRLIERKYSAGIVSALTGLTGNEVHWFMEYCAFSEDFLLKASDYEIQENIFRKFKIYSVNNKPK